MLNYHSINPETRKTTNALFSHYLTLGSHQSSHHIHQSLTSFSLITLYASNKFIVNMEKMPKNCQTLAIPLKGQIRINEEMYDRLDVVERPKYFEETNKEEVKFLYIQANIEGEFKMEKCKLTKDSAVMFGEYIRIRIEELKSEQKLVFAGENKLLVFVESGKLIHDQTQQVFQKDDLILINPGQSTHFTSTNNSILILAQLL